MIILKWTKDEFIIDDDPSILDLDNIFDLLSKTYWASNRTKEMIEMSIVNSISFGLFHNDKQIGFARVITDKVVLSWILDVVVNEEYRGNGLGTWLMECILNHPELINTNFTLATSDSHNFYKKFSFNENKCMTR